MQTILWLVIAGSLAGIVFLCWRLVRKAAERERSEEARFTAFMEAQRGKTAAPAPAVAPAPAPAITLETQKLLFEAAHKAGAAGEPALAIQLYARLLARFPDSAFGPQARAAVEAHKKKLAKA